MGRRTREVIADDSALFLKGIDESTVPELAAGQFLNPYAAAFRAFIGTPADTRVRFAIVHKLMQAGGTNLPRGEVNRLLHWLPGDLLDRHLAALRPQVIDYVDGKGYRVTPDGNALMDALAILDRAQNDLIEGLAHAAAFTEDVGGNPIHWLLSVRTRMERLTSDLEQAKLDHSIPMMRQVLSRIPEAAQLNRDIREIVAAQPEGRAGDDIVDDVNRLNANLQGAGAELTRLISELEKQNIPFAEGFTPLQVTEALRAAGPDHLLSLAHRALRRFYVPQVLFNTANAAQAANEQASRIHASERDTSIPERPTIHTNDEELEEIAVEAQQAVADLEAFAASEHSTLPLVDYALVADADTAGLRLSLLSLLGEPAEGDGLPSRLARLKIKCELDGTLQELPANKPLRIISKGNLVKT